MTVPWNKWKEQLLDLLGPMVVKELRQQLRSGRYTLVFLLVHLILASWLGISIIARVGSTPAQTVFWTVWSGLIFVAVPSLGIGTIRSDEKQGHLELILATGLTSWEYVLGKWAALTLQALLILLSLIPYLLIRYWLGRINLSLELSILFGTTIAGLSFLAMVIHVTGYRLHPIRSIIALMMASIIGGCIGAIGIIPGFFVSAALLTLMPAEHELFICGSLVIVSLVMGPLTVLQMANASAVRMTRTAERRKVQKVRQWTTRLMSLMAILCLLSPIAGCWAALLLAVVVFGRVLEGTDEESGDEYRGVTIDSTQSSRDEC